MLILKQAHFSSISEIDDEVKSRHDYAYLDFGGNWGIANFFNYHYTARGFLNDDNYKTRLKEWVDDIKNNKFFAFSLSEVKQRHDNNTNNSEFFVLTTYFNRYHSTIVYNQQNIPQKIIENGYTIDSMGNINAPRLLSVSSIVPNNNVDRIFYDIMSALGIS